jgi:protein involved in polysaccharide export with SLBB domain
MKSFLAWCLVAVAAFAPASARAQAAADSAAALSGHATTSEDWSMVPEYRIVPGDRLVLNFGPAPGGAVDILREAKVRPDGRISVFPVGDVVAAGRTIRDLEGAVVDLLAAEFKQPRVTIELVEASGNQIHVLGQVRDPGSYPAGPFMTLSQAVTAAGGFTEGAARNSVIVFHRDGAKNVRVARVAFDRAITAGKLDADIPLSRFDIVFVPRSTVGNIEVFTRQVLGSANLGLNTALVGWELFNLERVFPGISLRASPSNP